jgi:hypothetical protein
MKIALRAVELAVLGPFVVPVWLLRRTRKNQEAST